MQVRVRATNVRNLETLGGTHVVDVKPVIDPGTEC